MKPVHTVNIAGGSNNVLDDQLVVGKFAVTYAVGAGAGASVATAVTFNESIPTPYQVHVELPEDGTAWISSKTAAGFTLNVEPRLAANTVAGGSANVLVVA